MPDQKVVLIAEDQPDLLLTLEYLVRRIEGVEVLTATHGEDAVRLAIERRPMLTLLSVVMPRIDGYTACRQIRGAWQDYPGQIWFITARDALHEVEQAKQAGADRCIAKPFNPQALMEQLREALGSTGSASVAASLNLK